MSQAIMSVSSICVHVLKEKLCTWRWFDDERNCFYISLFFSTSEPETWVEPKFPTECYFMTLHCQHLALLPACRHYTQRARTLRELGRLTDDLQNQERTWKGTPLERRNRQLLERWKSQTKVGWCWKFRLGSTTLRIKRILSHIH